MNFFLKNKEFITLQITILPDLANSNNHYFILKVFINETLKPLLPIIKIFFQISMFVSVTEDKLFFNNKNKKLTCMCQVDSTNGSWGCPIEEM